MKVGDVAGSVSKVSGYRQIGFAGVLYYAHRLAWWFVHGEMPPPEIKIDHHDFNRDHNWIDNLRCATHQQNNQNRRALNSRPHKGTYFRRRQGKWQAAIQVNRRFVHLGYFETEEAASAAYDAAAQRYFGEFARLNS
jgi:hypothetical protein